MVQLRRYIAVDDVGNVVNPMIVDGQVHGGITHGVGQALLEGAVYDDNGQLTNGSYMDYAMPRADDVPRFETDRTVTPVPPTTPSASREPERPAPSARPRRWSTRWSTPSGISASATCRCR